MGATMTPRKARAGKERRVRMWGAFDFGSDKLLFDGGDPLLTTSEERIQRWRNLRLDPRPVLVTYPSPKTRKAKL